MTSISNGESGSTVRTKLNASLAVTDAFTVSGANVGIGATPTNAKLKVSGAATGAIMSEDTLSTGSFVRILGDVGSQNLINWQNGTAIRFATSNQDYTTFSERMRIDASGNVGIGTNAPLSKLDIYGAAASSGLNAQILNTTDTGGDNTRYAGLNLVVGSDASTGSIRLFRTNSAVDFSNAMTFWTKGSGAGPTSPTERMRIDASGNVGIGTTSPAAKLHVLGNCYVQSGTIFVDEVGSYSGTSLALNGGSTLIALVGGTERMRIDASGNVGIGTNAPNAASIVDAQSTTKGVRFPNMTTTQKNAIANVTGNVVFDTTLGKLCVNSGSGWQTITSV